MNSVIFCETQSGIEKSLPEKIKREYGLIFPKDYQCAQGIEKLAKAKRTAQNDIFCRPPLGHTVEAEAFGGIVKYNGEMDPYISEYPFRSLHEILHLPEADFTTGRISEGLHACRQLKANGFPVLLEVSGPFTILSGLLSSEILLRAVRKEPELFCRVWKRLSGFLLQYFGKIAECRIDAISYADPMTGADILGPKCAAQLTETLIYPFLKQAEAQMEREVLILLCPKISFSLVETGKAVFWEKSFGSPVSYGEACLKSVGEIQFAGEVCSKKDRVLLKNGTMKEVKLL